MIQSQGGPARPRDSSPGRLDRAPKHRACGSAGCARSPSTGPAGCLFSKYKAAGECPNPKAAESATCAPAFQALAARLVRRLRAQGTKYVTNPKRLDSPAGRARVPSQSGWSRRLRVPRTKLLDWLINGLIACQGPHLQNSEECDPGRKKSETNPSNHPLPLHRQDNSRNNLNGLKPTEDFFFFFPFSFPPELLLPLSLFFFFHSFFLPSFTIFMSSSSLLLSISMF